MRLSIPLKKTLKLAPLFGILLVFSVSGFLSCSGESISEARSLVDQWRLEEAQQLLSSLLERNPDDLPPRRLYAQVLLRRGELFQARDQYLALLKVDSIHVSSHRIELAFTYFYLGALDSAEVLVRSALSSGVRDSTIVSRCFNILGLIDFNRGNYDRAAERQRRSLLEARAASSPLEEANALRQLGVLTWYRGQGDSALSTYYLPALEIYRRVNDRQGEATTLSNIGFLAKDTPERMTALRYQLEAFGIRKQIGDLRGLADSYYFLTAMGNRGKSYGFLYTYRMRSLEISTRIGYAWGREVAARSLLELIPSAFTVDRTAGNVGDSVLPLTGEGRLYAKWRQAQITLSRKQWQPSLDILRELLTLCDSIGYIQGRQVALVQYAQALSSLNRFAEAERVLRRARQQNTGVSAADNDLIDLQLARTSLRLGKTSQARIHLRAITEYLDSVYLYHVRNPGMVFSLERITEMVYQARSGAYGLLVETVPPNDLETVFQFIEQERALLFWGKREEMAGEDGDERDAVSAYVRLLEQYEESPDQLDDKAHLDSRIIELQESAMLEERILNKAGKRVERYHIPPLRKLRESLKEHEAILQYFLMETKVIVLASRKQGSRLLTLGITASDLTASVRVMRDLLLRGKEAPDDTLWRSPASFLFETLLAPLERDGWIKKEDHLIIAPHRVLHLLPFHVLIGGSSPDGPLFVLEEYHVSTVPSATWFVEKRNRAPAMMQTILAAAPLGSLLPFSDQEIRRIPSEGFSTVKILPAADATVDEVVRLLPQFDVVHLATHSRMNPRYPLYSFIECSDDRLELHELFNHVGPRRLMILSACESGVSRGISDRGYSSDDIVSFPRAFIQNGVPSVIASLWLVEDESAAKVFEEFYSILKSREIPATLGQALTLAQRRFLANSKGNSHHPFFWAPFYLYGDDR